jgi:hypothetical protein
MDFGDVLLGDIDIVQATGRHSETASVWVGVSNKIATPTVATTTTGARQVDLFVISELEQEGDTTYTAAGADGTKVGDSAISEEVP